MSCLIGEAECCRIWPVVLGWPIRTCGICGEVPRLLPAVFDSTDRLELILDLVEVESPSGTETE